MTEEEKVETINKNAAVVLERFLKEIEEKTLDEIEFISETYARLIVASILGFSPSNLADDAEEAADKLFKMVEEEDEENT
jgi:hypothetical protein